MQRARRDPGLSLAVLFLDVDRFKLVNDSLSHGVGDRLLVALAARIANVLRPGDSFGEEFADPLTRPGPSCSSAVSFWSSMIDIRPYHPSRRCA